jgi:hypothetical protein
VEIESVEPDASCDVLGNRLGRELGARGFRVGFLLESEPSAAVGCVVSCRSLGSKVGMDVKLEDPVPPRFGPIVCGFEVATEVGALVMMFAPRTGDVLGKTVGLVEVCLNSGSKRGFELGIRLDVISGAGTGPCASIRGCNGATVALCDTLGDGVSL